MASYQSQYNLSSGSFDTITLNGATPNLPVLTDSDSNLTTGQIDLKTQVTGLLPTANGGTGASLALGGGKLIVSSGAVMAEGTSSTDPSFTSVTVSGLTASQPVKTNAAKALVSGLIDLATEATGASVATDNLAATILGLTSLGAVRKSAVSSLSTAGAIVRRDNLGDFNGRVIGATLFALSATSSQIQSSTGALSVPPFSGFRTITFQDPGANTDVAYTSVAQTLTNKTLAGTTNFSALTASRPLQLDASKNVVAVLIDLTSAVSGVLPVANGGSTGTNTGDVTLAAVGSSPNANGASIAGQVLTLQPASATQPGVVSSTTQSFLGNKTVVGTLAATNLSGTNTGDLTLAAVGSSPNANGASLAGQVLTLQPASSSQPGIVTAGTQSFNGTKTFTSVVSPFLGLSGATNQIGVDGGAVTTFINVPVPAGNRTITVPDAGTANASVVLTESAQTVNGIKTLASGAVIGTTGTTVGLTLNNSTASYSPAVLNHYETYSANVNLTGAYTATQVLAIKIVRVGAHVTLTWPTLLAATTNVNNIQGAAGDVPTRFAPAATIYFPIMVQSNSTNVVGTLTVESNGRLTFNNATFTSFAGSGNGGPYGSAVSWQI